MATAGPVGLGIKGGELVGVECGGGIVPAEDARLVLSGVEPLEGRGMRFLAKVGSLG